MTRAMIVVDVQVDFVEGGSLAVQGGIDTAKRIAESITYLKEESNLYDYFIATKDFHLPHNDNGGHISDTPDFVDTWPAHCIQGTEGSLFAPPIRDIADQFNAIFYKGEGCPAYSGFEASRLTNAGVDGQTLHSWLQEHDVTGINVVGLATDYCVKATALDGINLGYDVRVAARLTEAVGGDNAKLDALMEIHAAMDRKYGLIN